VAESERRGVTQTGAVMADTTSVVLAGVGGQGIILASTIVARAALHAGHDVKTNEIHGMAQRGGSVVAEIRYGSKVFSPLVEPGTAVALAALERVEAIRHAHYLKPGGLAVVSTLAIVPVTVSSGQAAYPADAEARLRTVFPRLAYIDATAMAEGVGNAKAGNVVILGALSTGLDLPEGAWEAAIRESVPEKHLALNQAAFAAGRRAVKG